MAKLTLKLAQELTTATCAAAERDGVGMAVAVVDPGGHVVSVARMDGVAFVTTEVAIGKAYTAAAFGSPSEDLAQLLDGLTQFTTSIVVATQGRFTLGNGGLPIVVDGEVIGGIGASGASGEQDLAVVEAALATLAG
jgi:glc operon protein GlcG